MEHFRAAGCNEKRCIIRDSFGLYGCIVTFGTYSTSLIQGNNLSRDRIVKALKACVVLHPALRTVVQGAGTESPVLHPASKLNLEHHLRILDAVSPDAEGLQNVLDMVHAEPLSDCDVRPQWRVHLAPCSTTATATSKILLVFASSHNILDGRSGVIFHDAFLKAFSVDNEKFDAGSTWTIPQGLDKLPPSVEGAGNLTISRPFLLKALAGEFLPASLRQLLGMRRSSAGNAWCGAPSRPEIPTDNTLLPTAVCVRLVSFATVSKAIAICRTHESRLTALLNFLFARALAQTFKSRGLAHMVYSAVTPVDLRNALPKHYGLDMGNYVTVVPETFIVKSGHLEEHSAISAEDWSDMKQSTLRLSAASKTLADQPVALLKYISNYRQWTLKQVANPAGESFSISNLGAFAPSPTTSGSPIWQVEQFGFSQSADATGSALGVNIATAKNGPVTVVVSWWPGILGVSDETGFVEEVCDKFTAMLEYIATEETT